MAERLDTRLWHVIVEQAPDGVIFADREGIIRLWNPAAEALLGYSVDEAIGQTLELIIPERFREAHWTGYRRAMTNGQTKYGGQVLPTRSMTKDGSIIYLEMTLAILRDDAGQVLGALAIVRDITERRAQERALSERMAELEQRVEAGLG